MDHLLNRIFGKYCQLVINENARKQSRLVMTLLARDEVDIIEKNILFHLNHGVDFVVATDNDSSDGTTEVLREYEKKGVLHLIHEPSRAFDQAGWVNRMGHLAQTRYGADFIFHCDADEFWYPRSGSLKTELLARPLVDLLSVEVINVLMRNKDGDESFPNDAAYAVTNPPRKSKNKKMDFSNTPFLLFKYPGKVIYKLRKGYLPVIAGNHGIQKDEDIPAFRHGRSLDVDVFHFPVRSFEQFGRKTINGAIGAENYERQLAGEVGNISWHLKRWHKLLQSGKLREEYDRLTLSDVEAGKQLEAGIVTVNDERHLALIEFLNRPAIRAN